MVEHTSEKPALLVFESDWHTNSVHGLNPLCLRREAEGRHYVGRIGRNLWRKHKDFWQIVDAKKRQWAATVYSFFVGDLGDLNKHSKVQLVSSNEAEVQDAMAEVADVGAQVSDHVFIIRGTEAHTLGNGKLEEQLAKDLDNAEWFSKTIASWWIVRANIGGMKIMATHVPPTSSGVPWGVHPAVMRAANHVFTSYADAKKLHEKPDICVWAHKHTTGVQGIGMGSTWGIFLPPWQLGTSYAHRIGKAYAPRNVGGIWMVVQGGKVLEWDWERWWMKEGRVWKGP